MSQTIQETNKRLVLEASDTLFNKRDYKAAERRWSPNYIQHSAHIRQVARAFGLGGHVEGHEPIDPAPKRPHAAVKHAAE